MWGKKDRWGGRAEKTEEGEREKKAKIFISLVTKGDLSFGTSSLTNAHKHEYKRTYRYPHCISLMKSKKNRAGERRGEEKGDSKADRKAVKEIMSWRGHKRKQRMKAKSESVS